MPSTNTLTLEKQPRQIFLDSWAISKGDRFWKNLIPITCHK